MPRLGNCPLNIEVIESATCVLPYGTAITLISGVSNLQSMAVLIGKGTFSSMK